jgi:hypothetical protein
MAQWELKNGSNAELLNISRSITTSSPQWVAQLQQALTRLPTPADCAAPAPAPAVRRRSMSCRQDCITAA